MHFKMEFRLKALMMLSLLASCLAGHNSSETHRSGRQKRGLVKMMMHIMWDPVRLIRYWYAYDVTKEIAKSWRKIIPTIMLLPITSQMPDAPGVSKYVNPPLKASGSHSVVKEFVYPDLPYGEGHQKHTISKDLYHSMMLQGHDAQDSHKNSVHLVPEYFQEVQSLYPGHFDAETQGSVTQFNPQPFGNGQAYEITNGNQAKLHHAFYGQQLTASDQHAFLAENNANGHHLVLHQSPKSANKHNLVQGLLKSSGTEHHKSMDGQYVFIQEDPGNGNMNRKENTAHHAIFQSPSGGFQFIENPMKSRSHQSNLNDAHKGLHLVFHPLAKNHKSHSSEANAQMAHLLPINLFRNGSAEGHLQAIPIILPNFEHLVAPNDMRSPQKNDNKRRKPTSEVFQETSNDITPTVDPESTVDTNSTKWKHVNRSSDSVSSKTTTRNIWVKKRIAKQRRKQKQTIQHLTDHEQTPVKTNSSNARSKTNRNRHYKSNNARKGSHNPYTENPPILQKLMNRQNINIEKLREDLKHGTPVLIPFEQNDDMKNAQPSRYTERIPKFSNSEKKISSSNLPHSKSNQGPNLRDSKRQDVGGQRLDTQTFPNEQSVDIHAHHSDLSKSKDRVMLFMTRQKL